MNTHTKLGNEKKNKLHRRLSDVSEIMKVVRVNEVWGTLGNRQNIRIQDRKFRSQSWF